MTKESPMTHEKESLVEPADYASEPLDEEPTDGEPEALDDGLGDVPKPWVDDPSKLRVDVPEEEMVSPKDRPGRVEPLEGERQ
jgi:hypothetical protein